MKKFFVLALSAFLLAAGGGIYLVSVLLLSLPPHEGKIVVPGLRQSVTITRDKWGVPHIQAQNELDLHHSLGFVMASDRLFQMDLLRRMANGQLSEIFGEKALPSDILLRSLRLRKQMDEIWQQNRHKIDSNMIKLCEAFLEGVHYYMQTWALPIEFKLLRYRPRPFTVQEIMAIGGYMALGFANGITTDALYSELLESYPQDMIDQLRIRHTNDRNERIRQKTSYTPPRPQWYRDLTQTLASLQAQVGFFHGSNSWVLAGKRSKTGRPLLANDPHIAFSSPGTWYEAHLTSPHYEIYGHFITGIPFPIMGHNRDKAWALTMAKIDDMDLYVETFNPQNPEQVMYRGEWVEVQKYRENIKVRGGKDMDITVTVTPHGPLIDSTKHAVKGQHISLKWSYYHPDNNGLAAFYKLSRATTLEQMKEALAHATAPPMNVSWIDRRGNIAWKVLGKLPLRRGFHGGQILDGSSGKHEYDRYLSAAENPGLDNPESGVIVTANYYPEYNGPFTLDGYWEPSERFERINRLLSAREKWSLEELKRVQTDQHVSLHQRFVPIFLQAMQGHSAAPFNQRERQILGILKDWRGDSGKDSVASSIYHMWQYWTAREALFDNLGEKHYRTFHKSADSQHFFKTLITQENNIWWDDSNTPQVQESRTDIIRRAFKKAVERLTERLGESPERWYWGRLHTVEHRHPLGLLWPLNYLFNIGPYSAGGGNFQIDNMSVNRYEDTFKVVMGPSTRRLVELGDVAHSWGILPTGNVGHFIHPFYRDQVQLFLQKQYRPQWMELKEVKKHPFKELVLVPSA